MNIKQYLTSLLILGASLGACASHHDTARDGGLSRDASAATADDSNAAPGASGEDRDADPGARADDGDGASAAGSDRDAGAPGAAPGTANDDAGTSVDGGVSDGGAADAAVSVTVDGGAVLCGDHVCACANGRDDDGDGRADLGDAECISSWDDDDARIACAFPRHRLVAFEPRVHPR